jgi:hypothetical protein
MVIGIAGTATPRTPAARCIVQARDAFERVGVQPVAHDIAARRCSSVTCTCIILIASRYPV